MYKFKQKKPSLLATEPNPKRHSGLDPESPTLNGSSSSAGDGGCSSAMTVKGLCSYSHAIASKRIQYLFHLVNQVLVRLGPDHRGARVVLLVGIEFLVETRHPMA